MSAFSQLSPADLFAKLDGSSLDGAWTLDPAKSTATIATKSMWGLAKINGSFTSISGQASVASGAVTATISIATASIDTKNAKRDKHLKSDDFFASETYPDLVFTLTSVKPGSETVTVDGTLSVRETIRPVSFEATVGLQDENEITLRSELDIDRSDYGIGWNQLGMASMANAVAIKAVFIKS